MNRSEIVTFSILHGEDIGGFQSNTGLSENSRGGEVEEGNTLSYQLDKAKAEN